MNLKFFRKNKKKTQQEIADFLNVKQQTYNGYETEKSEPTINTLIKLADYYNISLDKLIGHQIEQIDTSFATKTQKNIIQIVLELNDIECQKVEAYINGMLQAKKEYFKKIN